MGSYLREKSCPTSIRGLVPKIIDFQNFQKGDFFPIRQRNWSYPLSKNFSRFAGEVSKLIHWYRLSKLDTEAGLNHSCSNSQILATFLATFLAKNFFFAKVLQIISYPFGHLYLSSGTILEHYLADFGHKYGCIKFWNFGPIFTARGRFPPKMRLKSTIIWGSLKLLWSSNKSCVCSPCMRIQKHLYGVF